jgi:signal transduction histidine kinase
MTEADDLARDLYAARLQLQAAGQALHDQAGPLLSAAGIQLQLLRLDHPNTAAAVNETLAVLDEATESLRVLSQNLSPSPAVHVGLDQALTQLAEQRGASLSYTATTKPPPGPAAAIYETVVAALDRAVSESVAARISVRGANNRLAVRVVWKSRAGWPSKEVTALARRLRPAGVVLDVITKESTIVSIRYATRRTARR